MIRPVYIPLPSQLSEDHTSILIIAFSYCVFLLNSALKLPVQSISPGLFAYDSVFCSCSRWTYLLFALALPALHYKIQPAQWSTLLMLCLHCTTRSSYPSWSPMLLLCLCWSTRYSDPRKLILLLLSALFVIELPVVLKLRNNCWPRHCIVQDKRWP